MGMTQGTNGAAAATLDSLLAHTARLQQTKQAETAMSEPGSQEGPTSHPVKNVDDQLHPVAEGEQSQSNTKEIKKQQGEPSVDSTPDKKASVVKDVFDLFREFGKSASNLTSKGSTKAPGSGAAADAHYNIGLNVEATGEDPANETDAAKPGKEDPGSTHPARTDNDDLDGKKWSSDHYQADENTSVTKLAQMLAEVGESLILDIDYHAKQAAVNTKNQPLQTAQEAGQVGWELGGDEQSKAAVDNMLADDLAQFLNYWETQAVKVATYLHGVQQATQQSDLNQTLDIVATRQKAAMGGAGGDIPPEALAGMVGQGGGEAGGGAMPPEAQISPEDLEAMLGGGGGMGGAGGGMGGEAGGGMGGDSEVAELLQALEQEGISPEQAMELMNQVEGGGGEPKMGSDKSANENVMKYVQEVIARSKRR